MSSVFIPAHGNVIMPATPYGHHGSAYAHGGYPVQHVQHTYPPVMPVQRYYGPAPVMQHSYGGLPGPMPMQYSYGSPAYYSPSGQPSTVIISSSKRHHRHSSSSHRRSRSDRRVRFF
ncbi:hypothetical protein HGRIS_010847 [Hohenbuehelia grisea]|uniref:Uncharacterized protein n=1 Tax=Hohenbuehelia grisea TaxID=104357 RepID=A0ABR3IYT4_9AGAR